MTRRLDCSDHVQEVITVTREQLSSGATRTSPQIKPSSSAQDKNFQCCFDFIDVMRLFSLPEKGGGVAQPATWLSSP